MNPGPRPAAPISIGPPPFSSWNDPLLARLRDGASAFGLTLNDGQVEQCRQYLTMLLEWNQRLNLTAIEDGGIEVEYEGMKSFIRRSDLSRDRSEQRPERFGVGDKVDVRVTNVEPKTRKLGFSIKAREIAEEKEAVEQYGSSDSGASLGDILGAALKGENR